MRLILPILLAFLGLVAGGGLGWMMRPPAEPVAAGDDIALQIPTAPVVTRVQGGETLRLPNQFVVPLISEGRVRALVVIGLALELAAGHNVNLARDEPRLRAIFLQMLFDHANLGGFDGVFTAGEALHPLRRSLLEAARAELGSQVLGVMITELLRQES